MPNNQKTENGRRPTVSQIFGGSGNKSQVAAEIWERLGNDVENFKDPFCNTASILIGRTLPQDFDRGGYTEQINDADGLVVNALRAIRAADPKQFGDLCERSFAEIDLIAAHREFVRKRGELEYLLKNDIDHYELKLAVLFIWASKGWIGGGMGNPKVVVNKKTPSVSIARFFGGSAENHIRALQHRFRRVQIFCGDGISMVDSKTQRTMSGITAAVFDPPYSTLGRSLIYTQMTGSLPETLARRRSNWDNFPDTALFTAVFSAATISIFRLIGSGFAGNRGADGTCRAVTRRVISTPTTNASGFLPAA